MGIKRVNFVSIPVRDQDRALAFYCDVLGLKVQTDAAYGEGWRWIFLEVPGSDTMIQFSRPDEIKAKAGQPVLALVSDDVAKEVAALKVADATIIDGPATAPWNEDVTYVLFEDSEGNTVLIQSSIHEGA